MSLRPWQRQPEEAPADFVAFAAYLRLQGRRSPRAVAAQTGRSLGAIRRLSARVNWPARVAAFEARLADATQAALDAVLRGQTAISQAQIEQLRIKEYLLAERVIHQTQRWLKVASNPRRRLISITQICRLTEMAFHLARFAAGMPLDDQPRRRRQEATPGYWTGPSVEEALEKIYGSKSPAANAPDITPPPPAATAAESAPSPATATPPAWPPPDDKRDYLPRKLIIGPHGLLCLKPIVPDKAG